MKSCWFGGGLRAMVRKGLGYKGWGRWAEREGGGDTALPRG